LIERGDRVLRIPTHLSAKARKTARQRGKSDAIDARNAARAAPQEGLESFPTAHGACMSMIQAFVLEGGAHDGEQIDPAQPHPETLFAISLDDDEAYARTGSRVRDATGELREVFRFDSDGSLTEQAKAAVADLR